MQKMSQLKVDGLQELIFMLMAAWNADEVILKDLMAHSKTVEYDKITVLP